MKTIQSKKIKLQKPHDWNVLGMFYELKGGKYGDVIANKMKQ